MDELEGSLIFNIADELLQIISAAQFSYFENAAQLYCRMLHRSSCIL
jgi:hypothetical protein